MHFHCWELENAATDKDFAFVIRGQAVNTLGEHKACKRCCDCLAGNDYFRKNLTSPDEKQMPLCGNCNTNLEIGDFCGVKMQIGKLYNVEYNLCESCRTIMLEALLAVFKQPKVKQPKGTPWKRNIIV